MGKFCLSQRAQRMTTLTFQERPHFYLSTFSKKTLFMFSLFDICVEEQPGSVSQQCFSHFPSDIKIKKKPSGKVRDKEELHARSAAFYILYVLTCPGLTDCLKITIKAYLSLYLTFSTEGKLSPRYPLLQKKPALSKLKLADFQTCSIRMTFCSAVLWRNQAFHQCQAQTEELQLSQCDLYKLL